MSAEKPMESVKVLAEKGVFHNNISGFTPRTAQQEMAQAVEDAITFDGCLVAESGTGTGKTYAYLVPLILSGKKGIISTATKHLQEQVFLRDLPVVASNLGVPVNAVLLKGRSNYLCRYYLKEHQEQTDLIGKQNQRSYAAIEKWSKTTSTGDISEVSGIGEESAVWRQVTSTADNCLGGKCPEFSRCFVNKARQKALKADIVVVNHHLFFSDLTLKTDGFGELLPDHEVVVFDEAHNIAEVASLFFGFSVSSYQVRELNRDILAAEKKENSAQDFRLILSILDKLIQELQSQISKSGRKSLSFAQVQTKAFDDLLKQFQACLDQLEQLLSEAAMVGEELNRCHDRCLDLQNRLDVWIEGRDRELVLWVESTSKSFRLVATPLSVSSRFKSMMEGNKLSWIFTSATLAVGDDFSTFCDELGLSEVEQRRWQSPYDFDNNGLIYLPPRMPDPRDDEFAYALADQILQITDASSGRAFCLFTSYSMMEKTRQNLRGRLDFPMLVQGESPKQQLLNKFKSTPNSVLLGTYSFWEGVDVKGQSLSCVIIDKLPFASPGDPVIKSKLSACEEKGKNPFIDLQVPNAIITLKQGVGRLIRSESDYGVLVVCDSRMTTKRYGAKFINSLPPMPITGSILDVRSFFEKFEA
ncbi:MAG: ATP-dependent DNA helicase [Gammaproteobacteria bacterium]|nr:ATP-dependent DNA helicase [Gammaproteobacteria bacterium]